MLGSSLLPVVRCRDGVPALGRLLGIEVDHQHLAILRRGDRQMQRERRFSAAALLADDTPHLHTATIARATCASTTIASTRAIMNKELTAETFRSRAAESAGRRALVQAARGVGLVDTPGVRHAGCQAAALWLDEPRTPTSSRVSIRGIPSTMARCNRGRASRWPGASASISAGPSRTWR